MVLITTLALLNGTRLVGVPGGIFCGLLKLHCLSVDSDKQCLICMNKSIYD